MHSGKVDSEEVELSAMKDWPDGGILVFCSLLAQWPKRQDLGLYVRRVAYRSGEGRVMVDYSMTFAGAAVHVSSVSDGRRNADASADPCQAAPYNATRSTLDDELVCE